MGAISSEKIEEQRKQVFGKPNKVNLFAPCRIGEGVLRLSNQEWNSYAAKFLDEEKKVHFFIPASGVGSRMFQFLHEYASGNTENISDVENFLNNCEKLAVFNLFSKNLQESIKQNNVDLQMIANFILQKEGLNLKNSPKGLIPFHFCDPFILNPFQEHVLQGEKINDQTCNFHFTIQPEFEKGILKTLKNVGGLTGNEYEVEFSYQNEKTNSIAFLENKEPATENGKPITRPAGHGTLLQNLNQLNSDCILIKNIDNVQHFSKSKKSLETWRGLAGLMADFRAELKQVQKSESIENIKKLNDKYQFLSPSEINQISSKEELTKVINRPVRVCGMVKNQGQPGGGPFWIEDNGTISKQIVEKAQIANKQRDLMIKSTHFNPVMLVACTKDLNNQKLDLRKFMDEEKYFVVNKSHHEKAIQYKELPGLWNGSMANWNTIFVEIPATTFSPVKSILDLMKEPHQPKD